MNKKDIQNRVIEDLQFTENQQEAIKKKIEGSLRSEIYDVVEKVMSLLKKDLGFLKGYNYKVMLSDSCFNLMYMMEKIEGMKSNIISGDALLLKVDEIVDYYIKYNSLPSILLVTDVNDSGTYVSVYVHKLCVAINKSLKLRNIEIKSDIADLMQQNITLIPMIFTARGFSNKLMTGFCADMWINHCPFRTLQDSASTAYTQVYSLIMFHAVERIFSLGVTPTLYIKEIEGINKALIEAGFIHKHDRCWVEKDYYVRTVRSKDNVIVVYTLEVRYSKELQMYMIVPSVLIEGIRANLGDSLLKRILGEQRASSISKENRGLLLKFILNYSVIQLLSQLVNIQCYIDKDRLISYLGNKDIVDAVVTNSPYLTDWESLDNLLRQICIERVRNRVDGKSFIDELMGKSREFEVTLHNRAIIGNTLGNEEIRVCCDVMTNINQGLVQGNNMSVICEVLKAMSRGYIIQSNLLNDNGTEYTCNYIVTEAAQFVNWEECLNNEYEVVLIEMEKDCNGSLGEIIKRVDKFIGADKKLAQFLIEYVKYLYSVDQQVRYWSIYNNYIEVDEEFREKYSNLSASNLYFVKGIQLNAAQSNMLTSYRQMYPKR